MTAGIGPCGHGEQGAYMTQIRDSRGRIVANVDGYEGTHRVTYRGRHAAAARYLPQLRRPAHSARCECAAGYVCLTHRIAR